MTTAVSLPTVDDCWNRIGFRGDRSCPELARVVHCHNCQVFGNAGRHFLDAPSPPGYAAEWTRRLAAPIEAEPADLFGVLTFRLGEEWLALEVRLLVEVTTPRPVHRIPRRGGILAGVVNIRGELHLCVHLDHVLGVRRDAPQEGASKRPQPRLRPNLGAAWAAAARAATAAAGAAPAAQASARTAGPSASGSAPKPTAPP